MVGCQHPTHFQRRTLLKAAGCGLAWLTPVAQLLAQQHAEANDPGRPAKSVILLWLEGGPSQLETFDPHPDVKIGGGTRAIPTAAKNLVIANGLEQTAEVMDQFLVLRNVVSKEGDHERAVYHMKTGYRPDPSIVHPSIGAVMCHQLPQGDAEVPRHVSILAGQSPGRGGYLGDDFDAFQLDDPQHPLPDMERTVSRERFERRLADVAFLDQRFAPAANKEATPATRPAVNRAIRMMDSSQLKQFDLKDVPHAVQDPFGNTPFGRGCLVAARLIEVGVRCVEVTLSGWDSHVTNHEIHDRLKRTLDPALAALVRYLKERGTLEHTIVVCGGEFGRTPSINPAGGRDHWPHGFSVAIAGGGIAGGRAIGETDPEGSKIAFEQGIAVADVHASIQHHLGIRSELELRTPIGRPVKLSDGRVVF